MSQDKNLPVLLVNNQPLSTIEDLRRERPNFTKPKLPVTALQAQLADLVRWKHGNDARVWVGDLQSDKYYILIYKDEVQKRENHIIYFKSVSYETALYTAYEYYLEKFFHRVVIASGLIQQYENDSSKKAGKPLREEGTT